MKINEKSGILSRIFCHISDDMKTILLNFEPAKGFPELLHKTESMLGALL